MLACRRQGISAKSKKIINQVLDEINASRPKMPNDSRANIELTLNL